MRPCYTFTAKTAKKPAVLALDDEIGFWGTQAKEFRASLDSVEGNDLVVEINSPGGDVMAGLGMYNMLRNWAKDGKKVTTRNTGVAASIASVIMLAGDKREMPKNSFAMVHQASTIAMGTADDMRDAATVLDKIDGSIRGIYVDRMGVSAEKATEIMAKDTYLTADECMELGFATEITDDVTATAKFNLARADLPEHVAAVFKAQDDKTEPADPAPADPAPVDPPADSEPEAPETPEADQIVAKATAAGLQAFSAHFAVNCTSVAEAETRITAARNIMALCKAAGQPDAAAAAIKQNTPLADVRASLVKALAEADEHTDTTRKDSGNPTTGQAGGVSAKAVYEKRAAARKRNSNVKGT